MKSFDLNLAVDFGMDPKLLFSGKFLEAITKLDNFI